MNHNCLGSAYRSHHFFSGQVALRNIGAKAITSLGNVGPRLALSDIFYADFNKEANGRNEGYRHT